MAGRAAYRHNTNRTYGSHLRWVFKTAERLSISLDRPLSEHNLCLLVADHVRRHKLGGHRTMLSALSQWHKQQGFGPLPRNDTFKLLKKGLKNILGGVDKQEHKAAFTEEHMAALHATLDLSKLSDARDWATITMAWTGILRVSEYCDKYLRNRHVAIKTTTTNRHKVLVITVVISKTSSVPEDVYMAARADILCPVKAAANYMRLATKQFGDRWGPDCPYLFTSAPHMALSSNTWSSILKLRIISIGLDPTVYATHSFRRGGTTAMFRANVARDAIKYHGRWKGDAIDAYNDWDVAGRRSEPTRQLAAARPL